MERVLECWSARDVKGGVYSNKVDIWLTIDGDDVLRFWSFAVCYIGQTCLEMCVETCVESASSYQDEGLFIKWCNFRCISDRGSSLGFRMSPLRRFAASPEMQVQLISAGKVLSNHG